MEFLRLLVTTLPTLFAPQDAVLDLAPLWTETTFYVLSVENVDASSNRVTLHCFPGPQIPGVDFEGEAQASEVAFGSTGGLSNVASILSGDGSLIHGFSYIFQENAGADPVLRIATFRDGDCAIAQTFEKRTNTGYYGTEMVAVHLPSEDREAAPEPTMFVVTGNVGRLDRIDLFASPPGATWNRDDAGSPGPPISTPDSAGGSVIDGDFFLVGETGNFYLSPFAGGLFPALVELLPSEERAAVSLVYLTPQGNLVLDGWTLDPTVLTVGEPPTSEGFGYWRNRELLNRELIESILSPGAESNLQPDPKLDGTYYYASGNLLAEFQLNGRYDPTPEIGFVRELTDFTQPLPDNDPGKKVFVLGDFLLAKQTGGEYEARTFDGSRRQTIGEGLTETKLKSIRTARPTQPTTVAQGGPVSIDDLEQTHSFDSRTQVHPADAYLLWQLGYIGEGFSGRPLTGFEILRLARTDLDAGGRRRSRAEPGPGSASRNLVPARIGSGLAAMPHGPSAGISGSGSCGADDTTDCVQQGRFRVRAWYRTLDGERGPISLRTLTEDTGYGFIFDEANIELVYKTLNACAINGKYWVFIAGLTDLPIDLQFVDTLSGRVNVYSNPPQAFQLKKDVVAFDCDAPGASTLWEARGSSGLSATATELVDRITELAVPAPPPGVTRTEPVELAPRTEVRAGFSSRGSCVESADTLCLVGDRFRVVATYRTQSGASGRAGAVEITEDTGYLWFFDEANVEAVLKVLDACALNQSFWVFGAGLTNVAVEITITDTLTGEVRTYNNDLGTDFAPIQETSAFPCAA